MKKVKDLMVPLSEYATASEDATLYDVVMALEESQKAFDQTRYRHRAVLIYDKDHRIVGKVSQLDILRALEPKYNKVEESAASYGFSRHLLKSMFEQYRLWNEPLAGCRTSWPISAGRRSNGRSKPLCTRLRRGSMLMKMHP